MTQQWNRRLTAAAACWLPLFAVSLYAQTTPAELERRLDEMQTRLQAAQQQIDQDRANLQELRLQMAAMQSQLDPAANLQRAVAGLEEQQSINQAEIQVHEQEKVETVSKYSVKLHGLVLFNAAVNHGAVNEPSLPVLAIAPSAGANNGSVSATGRQTLLGLEATGPELWGARTYANLEMDFSAGLLSNSYQPGSNLFRLRTATMQMVWAGTTVQAGIAPLIVTPEHATSYFSIAEPALSWSGALWSWLPQLSLEHRFALSDQQQLSLQAALADVPDAETYAAGLGTASAAEASGYPASELRAAWHHGAGQTIGVGGYWSPHSYAGYGAIDAWAGTVDWNLPLPAKLQWNGEVYRGSALGGLSGGAYKDAVLQYSPSPMEPLVGLKDAGGWSQIKAKPFARLEMNLAVGLDSADNRQLRHADLDDTDAYTQLARNQTVLGNIIFRPTSTIILSGEYRHIRSWPISGPGEGVSRFGLAAGYAF